MRFQLQWNTQLIPNTNATSTNVAQIFQGNLFCFENTKQCPGNTTTVPSVDFFDNAFTYSNHTSKVTCCHPDNTFEVATCGQGASCAGQCSALGASLCPSGDCTDDPRTCDRDFGSDEDGQSGGSTDTLSALDLDWCTNAKHQCRVIKHKDCCYNPKCLKWSEDRKERCAWLNYLTGNF